MLALLEQNRPQIETLCRKYRVKRLDLFGSAACGTFEPASSDLDFLVLFETCRDLNAFDQHFGLLDDLKQALGRDVDLVDIRGAANPYFVAEALKHRVMLYAA